MIKEGRGEADHVQVSTFFFFVSGLVMRVLCVLEMIEVGLNTCSGHAMSKKSTS